MANYIGFCKLPAIPFLIDIVIVSLNKEEGNQETSNNGILEEPIPAELEITRLILTPKVKEISNETKPGSLWPGIN